MRLFIGTFLEKNLVEKIPLDEIQKLFDKDLKNIIKENIHMTWIFIGEVKEEKLNSIETVIQQRREIFSNLTFQGEKIIFWPPQKSPRLIVIEGTLNKEILLDELTEDLSYICSPDIKKDFLPHVTIARFKKDKTINKQIELPTLEPLTWKINEISLVQSILGSEGPKYNKIRNWQL